MRNCYTVSGFAIIKSCYDSGTTRVVYLFTKFIEHCIAWIIIFVVLVTSPLTKEVRVGELRKAYIGTGGGPRILMTTIGNKFARVKKSGNRQTAYSGISISLLGENC